MLRGYSDFRALHHTFVSRLVRNGASPKTAQILARHSDLRLMLEVYTHVEVVDEVRTLEGLPRLAEATQITHERLLELIREDLAASPFQGEGHRKVWARFTAGRCKVDAGSAHG